MGPEFNSCGKNSLPTITSGTGRASVQFVPESKWQPIETAPRDGARILLYARGYPMGSMVVAAWNGGEWFDGEYTYIGITHWQPLPEPPK